MSWRFIACAALFVTCLLTANTIATKLIAVGGLVLTAGIVIFPLSYVLGDVLTEGDEVLVKVIEVDANGKVRLSRKQALRDQPALADKEKLKIAPTAGA